MKIILSRKGFDSGAGRVASPILPSGRLVSLPIPSQRDPHRYEDVSIGGVALGPLVEDLTRGKLKRSHRCHLDPDLDGPTMPRAAGWRPAFGQVSAAQKHLAGNGVEAGDLFLFFGWFRAVDKVDGRWRYVRGAPNLHVIYGWMQVGEVIGLSDADDRLLTAHADHPHVRARDRRSGVTETYRRSNTLYVARDRLSMPGIRRDGAGLFKNRDGRVLTDPGQGNRSVWRLPGWFHPDRGTTLTYHTKATRWRLDGGACSLTSAARGQEFVITTSSIKAVDAWLGGVFE
jgi:hypothetical protein